MSRVTTKQVRLTSCLLNDLYILDHKPLTTALNSIPLANPDPNPSQYTITPINNEAKRPRHISSECGIDLIVENAQIRLRSPNKGIYFNSLVTNSPLDKHRCDCEHQRMRTAFACVNATITSNQKGFTSP